MWAGSPVSGCTSAAPTSSCWAGWFQLVRCGAFTCFSSTSKSGILPKMSTVLKSGRGGRRKKKKKLLKNKSRKKKVRAEWSRPDGQVDFLLDFFLAERKSKFRVYCFTSSEAEVWRSWSASIRHLQPQRMCLHSSICWAKAVQTPNLPLLPGWECGDCSRHGRELEQKTLCLPLPADTPPPPDLHDKCSVLPFVCTVILTFTSPFHHPDPMFMKKKKRGWCWKEKNGRLLVA